MLKDVSLYFTNHAFTVTVIARNQKGIDELISSKAESGFIFPLKVDYSDTDLLKEKLLSSTNAFGEYETVISRIHSYAESAHEVIADILGKGNSFCRYFDIKGILNQNPPEVMDNAELIIKKYENISYRKIILGFIKEGNKSRWLTDAEICNGVIDAVIYDKKLSVIGMTG